MLHAKFLNTNLKTFLPFLIFFWGMLLRGLFYDSYPFGFDQIQIADQAEAISHGDLTLIGPRTGPADMFTGPLIYYLASLFALIMEPYAAVIISSIFISAMTGISLYLLAQKYASNLKLITLMLWAFSPLLIHFDRISWNPNLTLLAAACVFFPFLKPKPLSSWDGLIISTGVFLGYQAHFSGLLLLPLAVVSMLIIKQISLMWMPLVGFGLSLAPTIFFDMRNNWLNLAGFKNLISNQDSVSVYLLLPRLIEKGFIVVETLGKLIFEYNLPILIILSGVILIAVFFHHHFSSGIKTRRTLTLALTWMIGVMVFFALYRQGTPEYYFFPLLPVLIYLTSQVIERAGISTPALTFVLGIYATLFVFSQYSNAQGLTYGNQKRLAVMIADTTHGKPVGKVAYDMASVDALGLEYFLSRRNIVLQEGGADLHLIYPKSTSLFTTAAVGDIGLWIDPRIREGYAYFTGENYIIGTPDDWEVTQLMSPTIPATSYAKFIISRSTQEMSVPLLVFPLKNNDDLPKNNPNVADIGGIVLKNQPALYWKSANFHDEQGYYLIYFDFGFFTQTHEESLVRDLEIITTKL